MGTKLQYATNVLAATPNTSSIFPIQLDECNYLQHRSIKEKVLETSTSAGLGKIQDSMDRVLEQCSIESIRKTMLMHENIFKQQVRELHRLYRVQKMLMNELKNEANRTKFWSPTTCFDINKSVSTPSTCGYRFDLERPADEDQAGPSSKKDNKKVNFDGSAEDCEVELTLSIGGTSKKNKSVNQKGYQSLNMEYLDHIGEVGSTESELREECSATFSRPHWLFSGLSLNREL